jgi:hypothetical protein
MPSADPYPTPVYPHRGMGRYPPALRTPACVPKSCNCPSLFPSNLVQREIVRLDRGLFVSFAMLRQFSRAQPPGYAPRIQTTDGMEPRIPRRLFSREFPLNMPEIPLRSGQRSQRSMEPKRELLGLTHRSLLNALRPPTHYSYTPPPTPKWSPLNSNIES